MKQSMTVKPREQRTGTQSIERSVALLREIATHGTSGWGLWDLADRCGLDRGTTHRILSCLVREGLVHQRANDRHYFLGPLLFELGASMNAHGDFQHLARTTVRKIARRFPASVALFYLRSGDDCVCIARAGSSSYTREGTGIRIGNRAPLLSLAGGAAILAAMSVSERSRVIERNVGRLAHLEPARVARMRRLVSSSTRQHYVFSESVVWQGVNSTAVPIHRTEGDVVGSLVVSGASSDYTPDRVMRIATDLLEVAQELSLEASRLPYR